MDRTTDTEMSEAAASSAPPGVRDLLAAEGNPSKALQAVMKALQTTVGNEAAVRFLARAREMYRSRSQVSDELASLFAECVIAEVQRLTRCCCCACCCQCGGFSILADGSSFKCGGLVSNHRKDEHYALLVRLILI